MPGSVLSLPNLPVPPPRLRVVPGVPESHQLSWCHPCCCVLSCMSPKVPTATSSLWPLKVWGVTVPQFTPGASPWFSDDGAAPLWITNSRSSLRGGLSPSHGNQHVPVLEIPILDPLVPAAPRQDGEGWGSAPSSSVARGLLRKPKKPEEIESQGLAKAVPCYQPLWPC